MSIQKEKTYGELALAHARSKGLGGKNQPALPTIKPGTAEWSAWVGYFKEHLGFIPVAMKRVEAGLSQEMTVPDRWPDQFDGSFVSNGEQQYALA